MQTAVAPGLGRETRPGSLWAGLGLAMAAVLSGVAAAEAGRWLGDAPAGRLGTVECVGFRDGGRQGGTAHILVANHGAGHLAFELRYLDLDRTVLQTERHELAGRSEAEVQAPIGSVGYAVQVRSTGSLWVRAIASSGPDGAGERREVSCSQAPVELQEP